jgi:anaerobic selenocysteine-containing dehydrogenase
LATERMIRSACSLCKSCCGVLLRVLDDKVVGIEGDPENPINRGRLCIKGQAALEFLSSPDRLKHPLKRVGKRGEGKWEQISWDEALDTVADAMISARDNYGVESVLIAKGMAKGMEDDLTMRFANAFGTPNVATPAFICYVPTIAAAAFTYGLKPGLTPLTDYSSCPRTILVWACNPQETDPPEFWDINQALEKGARMAVIDPKRIDLAGRADIWVQPRPGSDLALALAMINVIIEEGLYDREFVEKWTVGFDELKVHVRDYTPEKVAEITWVEPEKIRQVARFYATGGPACFRWGNGFEHNRNSFQAGRAVWILVAITGNFGVPGGNVPFTSPGKLPRGSPEFTLADHLPGGILDINLSSGTGMMPNVHHLIQADVIKAMLEEDPYPIHAAFFQSNNPLVGCFDARKVYDALMNLEFIAVADMFMTPTAAIADIVLPVATFLEYDSVNTPPNLTVAQVQRKVAQVGEAWSDFMILNELAKKLGIGGSFWNNEEEFLNDVLKPIGMTFEELEKTGVIPRSPVYRDYEGAFGTPSGKIELYSERLRKWGFDPLPVYYEPDETPFSDPELASEYPLVFTSNKFVPYRGSAGRQIPSLRAEHPEPLVLIHPETAGGLGIADGAQVYIETKRGRIKQKAKLTTDVDPRVIYVDYDWWFPEDGVETLYGWERSNVNILTSNDLSRSREFGTPTIRGILCRVYPADA